MNTEIIANQPSDELSLTPSQTDTALSLDERTYYRSRVFTAESGVNPLVSAAQPLLVLVTRISNSLEAPDCEQLAENLIHELKTFESRCLQHRYENEIILLGRYLLCVSLHDCLDRQPWANTWHAYDPLPKYFPSNHDRQHLLLLLDKISQNPNKYIEAIELAYIALSLSAYGQNWQTQAGQISITALLDQLYQRIRQHRGDPNTRLFQSEYTPHDTSSAPGFPIWITVLTAIILTSIFYLGFNYMINLNAQMIPTTQVTSSTPISNGTHEDL